MAKGNITNTEKFKRLVDIKQLLDDGKSDQEIVSETGLSLAVVTKNMKYLVELSSLDLSPQEISEKRGEIYLELLEASELAKNLFMVYKDKSLAVNAKMFFTAWIDTITLRARLFGLDRIPTSPSTQVNIQHNYEKEKIDPTIGGKIADAIKRQHETSRS